ncbi:hypothetical protein C8J57DRAFT_1520235 [Mycena rebaudengoi]|nr:hypothetical protein C8J57DRAFT_1520235 [Mycena rebaudengoi]
MRVCRGQCGDGVAAKRFSREGHDLNDKMGKEVTGAAAKLVRERAKLAEQAAWSRVAGQSDDLRDRKPEDRLHGDLECTSIGVYGTLDSSSSGVRPSYDSRIYGGPTTSSTSSSPGEQLFRRFDPVAHTLVVLVVPVNSKADGGSENFNVPRAAADSPVPTPRKTTSHIVLIWAVTSGLVALTIAAGPLLIYIPRRRLRRLNSTPSGTSATYLFDHVPLPFTQWN